MNLREVHKPDYPVSWGLFEYLLRALAYTGLPWVLMQLNALFKPNTRPLHAQERELAFQIFGNNIQYDKVRLDERSRIGCRRYHFAYVSFHFINSWGPLKPAHFIHEMVHIWQYQQLGILYIPRALFAQRTPEGYNYGGISALQQAAKEGRGLLSFNFEQQGDIVADYFCLKNGLTPRWCPPHLSAIPLFEAVIYKNIRW